MSFWRLVKDLVVGYAQCRLHMLFLRNANPSDLALCVIPLVILLQQGANPIIAPPEPFPVLAVRKECVSK